MIRAQCWVLAVRKLPDVGRVAAAAWGRARGWGRVGSSALVLIVRSPRRGGLFGRLRGRSNSDVLRFGVSAYWRCTKGRARLRAVNGREDARCQDDGDSGRARRRWVSAQGESATRVVQSLLHHAAAVAR